MNRVFLSIFFLLVSLGRTIGQEVSLPITVPAIMPPAPQAEAFLRYGSIPVDYSTGVPNISVPLYTLRANQLELPINISYHASGNKVNDVASPVGLGWVLNAGGIIVQTINGSEDSYPISFQFNSVSGAANLLASQANQTDGRWLSYAANARFGNFGDIASDRYYYNFNGHSGYFRHNMTNNDIETIPYSSLKIIRNSTQSITITDTEGISWAFTHMGQQTAPNLAVSGTKEYYLTSVSLPGITDAVVFTYVNSDEYFIYSNTETARYGPLFHQFVWQAQPPDPWVLLEFTRDYTNARHPAPLHGQMSIKAPLLTGIQWKNEVVTLNYSKTRTDQMKERLTHIRINKAGNLKDIYFDNNEYLGTSAQNYRMLLTDLSIGDQKYHFTYNLTPLPDYPSATWANFSEDFWGYYNGIHSYHIPFQWTNGVHTATQYIPSVRSYLPIREPDTVLTQAGIIQSLTYPTGGKTVFEFEQNEGKNVYQGIAEKNAELNYFGGLRIKKISNYVGTTLAASKYYEYTGGSTTTSITPDHFTQKKTVFYVPDLIDPNSFYNPQDVQVGQDVEFGASGMNGYPIAGHSGVGFYEKVTEYMDAQDKQSGKTEYVYSFDEIKPAAFFSEHDAGSNVPRLLYKRDYAYKNNSYTLIKEVNNVYEKVEHPEFLTGLRVTEKGFICTEPANIFYNSPTPAKYYLGALKTLGFQYNENFEISEVKGDKSFYILKESITKEVTENGNIETKMNYSYDPLYRILIPTGSYFTNSAGQEVRNEIKHSFNFSTPAVYNEMTSKHILTPEIEKLTYKNNVLTSKVLSEYRKENNLFVLNHVSMATGNSAYEKRIEYLRYNDNGNPLFIKNDGNMQSFIWSYKGQYPIAEIKGLDYTQIESVLGSSNIASFEDLNPGKTEVDNFINPLRVAFPDVHITSLSFSPLRGVTSQTDVRGVPGYYEYDAYHRLKHIKDANGYVLKSLDYEYFNPPLTLYSNVMKNGFFTKSNCPAGKVGGEVNYVVTAGTYTSKNSQEEADYKAELDIQANGQNYADNVIGFCTVPNTNPNGLFFVIENHSSQSRTVVLRRNTTQITPAVVVPANGFATVGAALYTGPVVNLVAALTSGPAPGDASLDTDDGSIPGFISSNLITFNNIILSTPKMFTINIY